MSKSIAADVQAVQSIPSVPTIMRVIAETTGMGWIGVTRVTPEVCTLCAVHDELDMGFRDGDIIPLANTLCDRVRQSHADLVIANVSADPIYSGHDVPRQFGFQSYFSIPVFRRDGSFFGTLCGLDPTPTPAALTAGSTLDTIKLFAQLLSNQIDAELRAEESRAELAVEREAAALRELFIAVLGHDLRTPLSSMMTGAEVIRMLTTDERVADLATRIERSGRRIAQLVDDLTDFARGKMGDGLAANRQPDPHLGDALQHVVAELRGAYPARTIDADIAIDRPVRCDSARLAQLLANLLQNAVVHGSADAPIAVAAHIVGQPNAQQLRIAVANGGAPIPPDKQDSLFEPFSRGAGSASSTGLGLGLYIAAQIAHAHGGALSVQSDAQRTVFTLNAPIT
ncbi:MAG: ATP-binding protein [Duganella sp.]